MNKTLCSTYLQNECLWMIGKRNQNVSSNTVVKVVCFSNLSSTLEMQTKAALRVPFLQ